MKNIGDVIVLAGTIVLLPLIPAFLLYYFLPAKTHVSGPFKGLRIQLTGAFAGYFLVAIGTATFVTSQLKTLQLKAAQLWTLRGSLELHPPTDSSFSVDLLVRPPDPEGVRSDGSFEIKDVPVLKGMELTLEVRMPSHGTQMVHFWRSKDDSLYEVKYDEAEQTIVIGRPLVLTATSYLRQSNSAPIAPQKVGGPQ
jgi:hypothetical protein